MLFIPNLSANLLHFRGFSVYRFFTPKTWPILVASTFNLRRLTRLVPLHKELGLQPLASLQLNQSIHSPIRNITIPHLQLFAANPTSRYICTRPTSRERPLPISTLRSPAMANQNPSTPVKVPPSAANYTPATQDSDLRSQINSVLLKEGHVAKSVLIPRQPSGRLALPLNLPCKDRYTNPSLAQSGSKNTSYTLSTHTPPTGQRRYKPTPYPSFAPAKLPHFPPSCVAS